MTNNQLIVDIIGDQYPLAQLWATAIAMGLAFDVNGEISLSLGMTRQALHRRVVSARKNLGIPQSNEGKRKSIAIKQALERISRFKEQDAAIF